MRNITAFRRSTPTYVYNISGADLTNINLDDLGIGMTISWDNYTAHFLPLRSPYDMFDITPSETVALFEHPAYATHDSGTNSFSLNIPLWRLPSTLEDEGRYQIYLFRLRPFAAINYQPPDGSGTPGVMHATNIVIDHGGFNLIDSLVPAIIGQAKRTERDITLI